MKHKSLAIQLEAGASLIGGTASESALRPTLKAQTSLCYSLNRKYHI